MAKNDKRAAAATEVVEEGVLRAKGSNLPNFSEWEEINEGFPPYLEVSEGSVFYATPVLMDYRNPRFRRYVFQIPKDGQAIECKRGPKGEQETVVVKPGETFTISKYDALHLEEAMGLPSLITFLEKEKSKKHEGQSYYTFSVKMSPENKAIYLDRKNKSAMALAQAQDKEKQLTA